MNCAPGLTWYRAKIDQMKVATFSIYSVIKRLPNLLEWLKTASPDVACLQELKTEDNEFT